MYQSTETLICTKLIVLIILQLNIMAEKPEDLNLPNAVISRLVKEAVRVWTKIIYYNMVHSHPLLVEKSSHHDNKL